MKIFLIYVFEMIFITKYSILKDSKKKKNK